MSELQNINRMIADGKLREALALLEAAEPEQAEVWFLKGKVLWRQGLRSEAMNAYMRAEALDPESPAVMALEQAREIERFFNPDLLNP